MGCANKIDHPVMETMLYCAFTKKSWTSMPCAYAEYIALADTCKDDLRVLYTYTLYSMLFMIWNQGVMILVIFINYQWLKWHCMDYVYFQARMMFFKIENPSATWMWSCKSVWKNGKNAVKDMETSIVETCKLAGCVPKPINTLEDADLW